jgi:hypothetical protein
MLKPGLQCNRRSAATLWGDEQREKKESRKGAKTQRFQFTSVLFPLRLCAFA